VAVAPATRARSRRGLGAVAGVTAAALLLVGGGAVAGHRLWSAGPDTTTTASGPVLPGGSAGQGSGDQGAAGQGGDSGSGGSIPGGSLPGGLPGSGGYGGYGADQGGSQSQKSTATTSEGQAAVATISPALVNITTTIGYGEAEAAGTGIVLTADGTVLTNHHVVEGATSITAEDVGNGQTYQATVVGYDSSHDVAVIKLADASGLATATVDQDGVAIGDGVVGVGNAGGLGGSPSAAEGKVTALDRDITVSAEDGGSAEHLTGLIETNAAIQAGDSGGALVDLKGEVVGVDTAASSANSTGRGEPEGYAIPIDDALAIAEQITSGESSSTVHVGQTAFLGVQLESGMRGYSTTIDGTVVAGVVSGSAADQIGLSAGDIIVQVDGKRVDDADALGEVVRSAQVGDSITVTWYSQSGQQHSGSATLGAGPVG
jgi:S1-C subfamily serine protease